jgi:archaellum component FlaC
MALDVTSESVWFLRYKINRLVREYEELPDKLIITQKQYKHLSKSIEVWEGYRDVPAEYLFHSKWNVMELEIR